VVALAYVEAQIGEDDVWRDERTVVRAVVNELDSRRPPFLADASGAWEAPFLSLRFEHDDGTVVEVGYGDNYTAIVGGGINYHGDLDILDATRVVPGILRGETVYVEQLRVGRKVGDYFEIVGHHARIGDGGRGLAGLPFALLRAIPGPPLATRRTRVSFDETPASGAA
jgi:hypothetical protein